MPATVEKSPAHRRVRRRLLAGLTAASAHVFLGAAGGWFRRPAAARVSGDGRPGVTGTGATGAVGVDSFQVKPPEHSVKRRG